MSRSKFEQIKTAIQNKIESGLEVRQTNTKGRCVFATVPFFRDDFVCEYAGELIAYTEAKEREKNYACDPTIGCYMFYFKHCSKNYCVDATKETNRMGRIFNHSRFSSNCHTKKIEINEIPYLILVASRDIFPGEELTFDYGDRNRKNISSNQWLAE